MTDLIVRILEVSLGIILISVTLVSAANTSTTAMNAVLVLLPLVAVPVICSGMFGWHPVKGLARMASRIVTPIKQFTLIKPHSSSL